MGVKFIKDETLSGIADAIREKTGISGAITAGAMAAAIASIAVGESDAPTEGGLINGYKFACGTFSFEEDQSSNVTIDHEDVGATKAVFLWCENATTEEVAYKVLAFYIPTDGTTRWSNSGSVYFSSGSMLFGNSATSSAHGMYVNSATSFSIGSNVSTVGARILGGKTYHWVAIGGG